MPELQEQVTEEIPVETAETPVVPAGETAKPEGAEVVKPVDERKFTQTELNAAIEKRLAREDRKRERELAAEVARLKEQYAPKPAETAVDPAAPKREDFADYETFIREEARFVARQEVRAERQAQQKAEAEAKVKAERDEAVKGFDAQMKKAHEKYPDFQDALEVAQSLPITDAMFSAMTALDEGADLVHFFGTHPEEATRISQLPTTRQAAEVGKLAAKVASPTPKPASVSQAPEPISPVTGGTAASDTPPEDPEAFRKWDLARMKARASGRRA